MPIEAEPAPRPVGGARTAGLRALTEGRVAQSAPGTLSAEQLSELAQGHHREHVTERTG